MERLKPTASVLCPMRPFEVKATVLTAPTASAEGANPSRKGTMDFLYGTVTFIPAHPGSCQRACTSSIEDRLWRP